MRLFSLHPLSFWPFLILFLRDAPAWADSSVVLTKDNFDKVTAGKTVLIKFFAPWCDHCKSIESKWERMVAEWVGHPQGLVGQVDCTVEERGLCKDMKIEGLPTVMYGEPSGGGIFLEEYSDHLTYEHFSRLANNTLKAPICSPLNMGPCDAETRDKLEGFHKMKLKELEAAIAEKELAIENAEADFKAAYKAMQQQYDSLAGERQLKAARIYDNIRMLEDVLEMNTASTANIRLDDVGGASYYYCPGEATSDGGVVDLIMLHGAKFTKEDWKASGIVEKLCAVSRLSVVALDLPNGSTYKDLKESLDGLRQQEVLSAPQVALVTPSASGYTIVDWITKGDVDELSRHIGMWIPVASPAVMKAGEDSLKALKDRVSILALYGSRDPGGRKTSQRLKKMAGAKVIEIEGGHPCYLDSPDDFVRHVRSFLSLS